MIKIHLNHLNVRLRTQKQFPKSYMFYYERQRFLLSKNGKLYLIWNRCLQWDSQSWENSIRLFVSLCTCLGKSRSTKIRDSIRLKSICFSNQRSSRLRNEWVHRCACTLVMTNTTMTDHWQTNINSSWQFLDRNDMNNAFIRPNDTFYIQT